MSYLRDLMTTVSKYHYLFWRATQSTKPVNVRLRNGEYLSLRPEPTTDLAIAYEIFVDKTYACPYPIEPSLIHYIVDVGANVGFSIVFWLYQYPEAQILAYEPNPDHLKQIQTHLEINKATKRVSISPVAAGVQTGEMYLTDEEAKSKLCSQPLENTTKVPVIDWFNDIKNKQIDLLKIDIEGGEYYLLADPRFERVKAKIIVLEWHATSEFINAADWCANRLCELGYSVLAGDDNANDVGLLWGFYQS